MKLSRVLFLALTLLLSLSARAEYDEGIEYKRISPSVPTEVPAGKIEVVELFWYGCPHCYRFEPLLEAWVKKLPDDVVFRRVPAVFNPLWALHAKAYYTAQLLKVLDRMHPVLFDAMHVRHQKLNTPQAIRKLFVDNGVDGKAFDQVFNSFAVDVKLRRATELTRRYGIDGVPSLVIQGTYRTDGPLANGHQGMLKVADHLIALERKRLRKAK